MSLPKALARKILPPAAVPHVKYLVGRFEKGVNYLVDRFEKGGALLGQPFRDRLAREMKWLEWIKSDAPIRELATFPEMQGSGWLGLETLAYQLVIRERPKVIVELGTYVGLSALAMGAALRDLGEGGQLFAVDSWEGDPHAGFYGDELRIKFIDRRDSLGLGSTIVPLKMYFDEARDKVTTPIDLLHIDGLHTFEAVTHDYETFGPLVRPGGLILFHDVATHFEEMRVFWSKFQKGRETYTVLYSHGLGIVRV
jgi:predicted O-methyltransferase YrrM